MAVRPEDFGSANLAFAEELYERYVIDPNSVPAEWRAVFEGEPKRSNGKAVVRASGPARLPMPQSAASPSPARDAADLQDRVDQLVRSYRVRGHMVARIDPLDMPRPPQAELDPSYYGLTESDMDVPVSSATIGGTGKATDKRTLREILARMRNTYCRSIGVQFMHMDELPVKRWLQDRMESTENRLAVGRNKQLRILRRLTDAVVFEEFIQKKYLGAKSFSLEGAESLIPLLELAIDKAGEQGVDEIVIGMAHRGRLNVLANIMGKRARDIFREFEDRDGEQHVGRGDVKYHLGFSHDWLTITGHKVHLSLAFNPSHLEFVNPVAIGRMRAKQDRVGDLARERGLVLLVHGDAAFAGEGVVQETLNLSQLEGYRIGGAIHVIVNNQIGFTTSPSEARSSVYATDIAKMLQSPIFHVNGEDPEAVAQCIDLALDFRRDFQRDVVIDMYCYRRRGHNEGDEPSFTQPLLYKAIATRRPVREAYLEHLLALGDVTRAQADDLVQRRRRHFETELATARSEKHVFAPPSSLAGIWNGYIGGLESEAEDVDTAVPRARLQELLLAQVKLPDGFRANPKIERALEIRRKMAVGELPLDWAAAESLAYATLAMQGHRVRLSGQDSERGTFSHRHAVFHDVEDGRRYMPLQHLHPDQAPVEIVNSPLSETGVLGFEYGYSLDYPEALVLWEAQFGDFVNAAQVIVDQFIASAEDKWRRLSALVLLLPHGFEGMGPEHSSGRMERFLNLAAEDNLQVASASTPAQFFHLLRRQVLRKWRKPLVVMTPKSLLRNPAASSSLDELGTGGFLRILPDPAGTAAAKKTKRVLLCSGKIAYELLAEREATKRTDVAILRVEQLYPLYDDVIKAALAPYPARTPCVWVQEEPANMGAWAHLRMRHGETLVGKYPFHGVTRPAKSSPATGSAASHKIEQRRLIDAAFAK